MPVVINEFEVVVPSAESTPAAPTGSGSATPGPAWSAEFARKLQEQLNLALERAQRLQAD
jgi:hypothetical protein